MPKTKVSFVSGKTNTIEFEMWSAWLRQAGRLVDRYIGYVDEDDPFAYNETASVALLASAASLAGYSALAEYVTKKLDVDKADPAKVAKRNRNGRGDLWLQTDKRNWAFEFKQRMNVGHSRADGRLASGLADAEKCASKTLRNDGNPVAAFIVSMFFIEDDDVAEKASEEVRNFAIDRKVYCWELIPPEGRRPTFLIFKLI